MGSNIIINFQIYDNISRAVVAFIAFFARADSQLALHQNRAGFIGILCCIFYAAVFRKCNIFILQCKTLKKSFKSKVKFYDGKREK